MKDWRPQIDFARLAAAFAEEILAATERDMREVSAASGYALGGAARDVRKLIAAACDEQGEADVVIAGGVCLRAPCARQH